MLKRIIMGAALAVLATSGAVMAQDINASAHCNAAVGASDWPGAAVWCRIDAEDSAYSAEQAETTNSKALRLGAAGYRMLTVAIAYRRMDMQSEAATAKYSARRFFQEAWALNPSQHVIGELQDGYDQAMAP